MAIQSTPSGTRQLSPYDLVTGRPVPFKISSLVFYPKEIEYSKEQDCSLDSVNLRGYWVPLRVILIKLEKKPSYTGLRND